MSREVRRVPVGWKHPVEHNPYWEVQQRFRRDRGEPDPKLHAVDERHVGLCDGYADRLAEWEQEVRDMETRTGHGWTFAVEYHLTGFQGRDDTEPIIHPYYSWSEDGQTETVIQLRDEDHLHELELAKVKDEKPDPAHYMPTFEQPVDELGWCLYETVSEGTPVTPVFATAAELIDHLATVGQDRDQVLMRRAAAEQLVTQGGSFGSMVAVGGRLYQSDTEADRITEAFAAERSS